jgi:hypothetical protein
VFQSVFLPAGSRIPLVPLPGVGSKSYPPTDLDVTVSLVRANVSLNPMNTDGNDNKLPTTTIHQLVR